MAQAASAATPSASIMMLNQSTSLKLHRLYGLKGDVKDNIHYYDEYSVIYPCGYNLVVYNMEKKQQKFIPLSCTPNSSGTADITCMAVSSIRSGPDSVRRRLRASALHWCWGLCCIL